MSVCLCVCEREGGLCDVEPVGVEVASVVSSLSRRLIFCQAPCDMCVQESE